MHPKYINTNIFTNQGHLLIHYESLPSNSTFILNNLKTNFEKIVLFSTNHNNALHISDLDTYVSQNRIALVLCDDEQTVLAFHRLCVYVGSFYNYSFNLPDFYCFVYEINYPISACIVSDYVRFEVEKVVSNNKNHLYTPAFENIDNRITKYYINTICKDDNKYEINEKNKINNKDNIKSNEENNIHKKEENKTNENNNVELNKNANTNTHNEIRELPMSKVNYEIIKARPKDCNECFDIEKAPKEISEIIDTNIAPFTYFPTLDTVFDISVPLSTTSELDLITKISEADDARRKQYYVQHIKTSAESLQIAPQTFSTNVNLKPKHFKIVQENKLRLEAEKLNKDNEYMRKLYIRYKDGDDDAKHGIITKKYNEYVTNRIQLLALEFYYNRWILENRKKEVDESLLLDVYRTCLYVIENGTEREREYAMEKLKEVGFDNTVAELKYKLEVQKAVEEKNKLSKINEKAEKKLGDKKGNNKVKNNKVINKKNRKEESKKEENKKYNKAEDNKAEDNKLEDNKKEDNKLEENKLEENIAEIKIDHENKTEQTKSEQTKSEQTKSEKLPYKVRDKDLYFQLKYAGHYLKRSTESRPDSRVNFTPDGWQIKLLDSVDNNNSSIVCAPTSSGKTFICYYAIEKVLKGAETDVVIFCLPTKALVNQVMADIYARFSTKTYKHRALQGILMKDYQVDPWKSQVLILTPLMLETLLSTLLKSENNKKHKKNANRQDDKLSGELGALAAMIEKMDINDNTLISNIKKNNFKLSNIKYIIIDEVHMICTKEMGTQIQRIVHMSQCPLLLLSATLGNLDTFFNWMQSVEKSKGRLCELVQYKERYCEIRNFVYHKENVIENVMEDCSSDEVHCMEYKAPTLLCDEKTESSKVEKKEQKKEKTQKAKTVPTITPINPLFGYCVDALRKNEFSAELTLLPDQLLDIFYTLYDITRNKIVTKALRPQTFFKTNIITKKDVKEYQNYIFDTIKNLYRTGVVSDEQINLFYDTLVKKSNDAFESADKEMKLHRNDFTLENNDENHLDNYDGRNLNNYIDMENNSTNENNDFEINNSAYNNTNENTSNINEISNNEISFQRDVLSGLPLIDTNSYDLHYMLENITGLVLLLKEQDLLPCIIFNTDRSICDLLAEKVYRDLEEMERKEAKVVKKKKEYKRPKEILRKDEWIEDTLYEEENIREIVNYKVNSKYCLFNTLYRKSDYELTDVYKVTENMFYRGIGVHHNGKNKKTRLAVETLFRAKHVACVFSTETLSLGINMPCKTVVFAGDYKLGVVEYKQMAGRAGRRGFDLMGNVVFFGMNKIKARSLIMSEVSNMRVNSELMCNTSIIGNDEMRNSILKDSLFETNYAGKNSLNQNKPCVVYGNKIERPNDTGLNECIKTRYINDTGRKDALSDYLNQFDRCEYTKCSSCHEESNEEMMCNDFNLFDAFSNPRFRYLILDIQREILLKHYILKNNDRVLSKEEVIQKRVDRVNDLKGKMKLFLISLGGKEYDSDFDFKIENNFSLTKFADILITGREQDPQTLSFVIFLQYLYVKGIKLTEPKVLMFYIAHFFEIIPTVDLNNSLKPFEHTDFVNYINTMYYDSMGLLFNSKLTKIQNNSKDFLFNLCIFPSFDMKSKNNYLMNFYEHGRTELIRKNNDVGIKTLWASCYVVDNLLEKLNQSGDKCVKLTYEHFHSKFRKIFA